MFNIWTFGNFQIRNVWHSIILLFEILTLTRKQASLDFLFKKVRGGGRANDYFLRNFVADKLRYETVRNFHKSLLIHALILKKKGKKMLKNMQTFGTLKL